MNLELGEPGATIENFNHVINVVPDNYLAWFYIAKSYQNLGQIDTAENIYRKIAGINDFNYKANTNSRTDYFAIGIYAMFHLARIYLNTDRPGNAEKTLREIIQNQMTFGPAYRLLGNVYARKGDSLLSKKYTSRANDLIMYEPPLDTLVDKLILISRSELYLLKQIDIAVLHANSLWAIDLINLSLKYIPDNKSLISKAIIQYLRVGLGKESLQYLEKHLIYFGGNNSELMEVAYLLFINGFSTYKNN